MRTRQSRLARRQNRGSRIGLERPADSCRFLPQLECLELRLLLALPQVLSHDLPEATETPISGMNILLSEAVEGTDARQSDTYELLYLGADHAPGGGDDWVGGVTPSYTDGGQQIDLQFVSHWPVDLEPWRPLPHIDGSAGTWTLDTGRRGVAHTVSGNGQPAYMVSGDNQIDTPFEVLAVVDNADEDNFIGVAFAVQPWQFRFVANDYYVLTWKKAAEVTEFPFWGELTAEEGFKLLRVKDCVGWNPESMTAVMWDGENYPPDRPSRVTLLDSHVGEGTGWDPNVEYAIQVGHFADGRIDVQVRRSSDKEVLWQTSVTDPNPLAAGRVGFFNQDQPGAHYTSLGGTNVLTDGVYQVTMHSGDAGVRGLDGTPLDGDGDGQAGGDFVATALVDTQAPKVESVELQADEVVVSYLDQGGMDPESVTNPELYSLIASGGDQRFDDGNEQTIEITSITRRVGPPGVEQAVLTVSPTLVSDQYRFRIDGTEGVTDRFGHDLDRGDYQRTLPFSTGPTQLSFHLTAETDTGLASDDAITNLHAPTAELQFDRPGPLRLDLDGDGKTEIQEHYSSPGTYLFPVPVMNDGEYQLRATFGSVGTPVTVYLDLTIDSVAPSVQQFSPSGTGLATLDHLDFTLTEPVLPTNLTLEGFEVLGPGGVISPTGLTDLGELRYRLDFPEQAVPGLYQVLFPPVLEDVAGNRNENRFAASMLIDWEVENRIVLPGFEQSGWYTGMPTAFGSWGGDRVGSSTGLPGMGIVPPEGQRALIFDATGTGGSIGERTSDAWQLVDLTPYRTDVAAGLVTAWASAQFNRWARDYQTDTQFSVELAAFSGEPANFAEQLAIGPLASAENVITTDTAPETWQPATVTLNVPATANYLALRLSAWEDVFDDDRYEFDGHYADDVQFVVMAPRDKPAVLEHMPSGVIAQSVDAVELTFNEPIDPSSFTVDDLFLRGPEGQTISPISPPVHLGDNVWRIEFPAQSTEGTYHLAVGPLVRDLDGNPLDQNRDGAVAEEPEDIYDAVFTIDFTALQIVQHTPDGVWNSFVDAIEVTFSEPINPSSFTADDVDLVGPAGTVEIGPPVHVADHVWQIPLPTRLESGPYTLIVGPQITDLAGQQMPQAYTGQFEIIVPNLTGELLTVPTTAGPGSTITVAWRVENSGSGLAESWRDEVYLSSDAFQGDDVLLGSFESVQSLAGGEFYEQSIELPIPTIDQGDYWILVSIDAGDEISEPSESDNLLAAGPLLLLHPNLTVGDIQFPQVVSPGQRVSVEWTVTNASSVPAVVPAIGRWYDQVAVSWDDQPGNDWSVASAANRTTIEPWGQVSQQLDNVRVPELSPGDHWVVVTADSDQQLTESDELDNAQVFGPVTVLSLDLIPLDVQPPEQARSGEPITARWRVHNSGSGTIDWVFREWVSLHKAGVIGFLDDRTLTFDPATDGPLGPGDSIEREITFVLPDGHDGAGDFSVVVTVDPDWIDDVYEKNEEGTGERNNVVAIEFSSDLSIYPDLIPSDVHVSPELPMTGGEITVTWQIRNVGVGDVQEPFWEEVRIVNLSSGEEVIRESLPYDPVVDGSIVSGQTRDRQLVLTLPEGSQSAGQLRVEVTTDVDQQVLEVNPADDAEQNNMTTHEVSVTLDDYPDLAITTVTSSGQVIGDPAMVDVSFTVSNLGAGSLTDETWSDHVIASTNSILGDRDDVHILEVEYSGGLGAGESYTVERTIRLPIDMEGRFHLFAVTDYEQLVFEDEREQNNQREVEHFLDVMKVPYADLVVTAIEAASPAASGQPTRISWTVENVGVGMTTRDSWYDYFYLATDPVGQNLVHIPKGNSSTPWESRFEHMGYLDAGEDYTHSTDVVLPDGLEGVYYFVVAAAPQYGPFEFVYDDNNSAVSAAVQIELTAPPDLTVSEIVVPDSALEDTVIDVSWTVANQGAGDARGTWIDQLLLRDASQPDSPPISLGTFRYEGELAAGISYTRRETVRVPRRVQGDYRLVVHTNLTETLYEHNATANNLIVDDALLPIQPKPRPDLQVVSVVAPETVESGGPLSVEWVVANQGSLGTPSRWVDRAYLSLDNVYSADDLLIGTIDNPAALASGESYSSVSGTITVPLRYRGDLFVLVTTDAYGQVDEWPNDANNTTALPVYITPTPLPDLVVSDVVVPTQAIAGATIEVRYSVTNLGVGDMVEDRWTDTIWLATDKISPARCPEFLLGSFERTGSLAVGEGLDFIVTVTLPADTPAGQYYITPWTDPYELVVEDTLAININPDDPTRIDNNNYKARPIDLLNFPTEPDLVLTDVTVTPAAKGGDRFTVRYTVQNQGTAPLDADHPAWWNDRVYLSDNPDYSNTGQVGLELPEGDLFRSTTGGFALAVGESYTDTIEVVLSPSAVGKYVFVAVDRWGTVAELSEANNVLVAATEVAPVPADLVITQISAEPFAVSGEQTTIRYTVTNVGQYPVWPGTRVWRDSIWLSADPEWVAPTSSQALRGSYLGEVIHVHDSPIAPGDSYEVQFEATLPHGLDGDYFVHVHLNASPSVAKQDRLIRTDWWPAERGANLILRDNQFGEMAFEDPRNNLASAELKVEFREPDLQPKELEFPAEVPAGEQFSVAYTVMNCGTRDVVNGWYDMFFLSRDPWLDEGDYWLGAERSPSSLQMGQSYTQSTSVVLPKGIGGDFYVLLMADSDARRLANRYVESGIREGLDGTTWSSGRYLDPWDQVERTRRQMSSGVVDEFHLEANNLIAMPLQVTAVGTPDLQVTEITLPERAVQGQELEFSFTVSNLGGDVPASTAHWSDLIYLSRDSHWDPRVDRYLQTSPHSGALSSGESYTVTATVRLPQDLAGPYYLCVVTDPLRDTPAGMVLELGAETNNVRSSDAPLLIEVPPPADLQIETITIPLSAKSGEPLRVEWTVFNRGENAATGSWQDTVYLSTDATWDLSDALLGRVGIRGPLGPGVSYDAVLEATVPAVVAGSYRVITRTDIYDQVTEAAGEANNRTTSADTIRVGMADLVLGVPLETTLASLQQRLYQLQVPGDATLRVTVDAHGQETLTELYLRHGESPSSTRYDAASAGQIGSILTATIPATQPGSYYVLLRGQNLPSPHTPVTILAELVPLSITNIHTDVGGDGRYVTTTMEGAQFHNDAIVKLVRPGFAEFEPVDYRVLSRSKIVATFDLTGAPHGLYDVTVINPGDQQATLPYRFQIERALPPDVTIGVGGPAELPAGEAASYSVVLYNLSNLDAPYVYFQLGVPQTAPNEVAFNLPRAVYASNLRGTPPLDGSATQRGATAPESASLPLVDQILAERATFSPLAVPGAGEDLPWASLESGVNLDGNILYPGYLINHHAQGSAGFTVNIATYPALKELEYRNFEAAREKIYAVFPDLKAQGALDSGPEALDVLADGLYGRFLSPEPLLSPCEKTHLPFRFYVAAASTAMSHDEFVAQVLAEATQLRQAILADPNASGSLITLATDEQVWSDLYLAALEQAGILRSENQSPSVSEQPHIISLMATLASGILFGPAGKELRSSDNLLEFFQQLRAWYGDDPDAQADSLPYNLTPKRCPPVSLPQYVPPEASDYDLNLDVATHFEAFEIWAPYAGIPAT